MPDDYRDIQNGISDYVQTGTIIFLILVIFFIGFILFSVQKRRSLEGRNKQLQSQFQKELLQSQLEIQEQTLKNISQEIHDNIGQALSLAKLNLNTLHAVLDETQQQKILNSKELVSKAITDLRDLSRSLDTDYIQEMGLQKAIAYELELIKKTGTLETSMTVDGAAFRFEKQKELILFRIVQETFNNIIKHAGAKNIFVVVSYTPTLFSLSIKDDGRGVNLQPLNESKDNNFGLGIRNMHNRAKLIGAEFSMSSTIGQGTEVIITLPKQMNGNGTDH
jgi:signal transduction histidine kinase